MSKRVLVIDDDEAIRKSFTLALEDTDFGVYTAELGEKGIQMAKESKFHLIFLDLKMPGMNGVETLRELRKIDGDVPIYIVTAFHIEFLGQLQDVTKEGINFELLHKPVALKDIASVTKGILVGQ